MKKIIILLTLIAILGVALGYLGGFIEFKNESVHGAEYSSWEYEWLMLPAFPGLLISSALCPVDYQLTQHWSRDKHSAAVGNGVVFGVLAIPAALLIRRKREASNKSAAGNALQRA